MKQMHYFQRIINIIVFEINFLTYCVKWKQLLCLALETGFQYLMK